MLLFIDIDFLYLNTSNVNVNQMMYLRKNVQLYYLNTSNVNVNQSGNSLVIPLNMGI